MIELRPATLADAELLLAWANDPATRASGFHPEPIDRATHAAWLADRLGSRTTRLWIGMEGDAPIGQVRLEREPNGETEVGISVAPTARRRGVGRRLLTAALEQGSADEAIAVRRFVARIRPENAASIALFLGAGFTLRGAADVGDLPALVYERGPMPA